ncbi:helix-turn-helix domain-containing protein [Streptomyces sp. NPDC002680]|uniref:helix-turn-helix domain-containing protein n=1 Tax=Streptomyces sp. NPDC002680 TaxID=3364659 RepID=UPI00367CDCF2
MTRSRHEPHQSIGGTHGEAGGRYLEVDEAAAYLCVSRRWMYRESGRHGVPRYYFGGRLRFKISDLDRWARQQRVA